MTEKQANITDVNIVKEMHTSYLDYAMSVIVGRALPDLRDGLKPVHRRILYTMHEIGNQWNRPYKKSARVVGDVMGKYHPHGDTAIYDAIVRMAQSFSMSHVLIDGQGNFGSIDGDSAAAMRYTEVRMSRIASELLADIEKETVDFVPNYDGSTIEASVLPARTPNLLVNGSSGIAVGMSTNIPPHNLSEVLDAITYTIGHPESTIVDMMKIIKGPDFPTRGYITGSEGIANAYRNGRGIIKIRGKVHVEEGKKDKIVITELPYQVNKAKLIEKIASLYKEKKVEGISAIRDESNRKGMRVVIDVKKGENTEVIINCLYKLTQLSDSFGIILLALHNGQPRVLNLKEIIDFFIQHRKTVVVRRTAFELRKSEARLHIVGGLLKAISNVDAIVALIKKSKNGADARQAIMKSFSFTEIQAKAILDMRLQRLTGLETSNLEKEFSELNDKIKYYKKILSTEKMILDIIKEECKEIKDKYGIPRRTEIISEVKSIEEEDMIQDEEMIITISSQGYIKRNSPELYTAQRRGGKGIKGMAMKGEDFVKDIFMAKTKSYILCFTNLGRVYWLKAHKIPESSRIARGKAIVNLLRLSKEEKVCSVLPVDDFNTPGFIVMATRKGTVKKATLSAFSNPRPGGINALTINAQDALVNAIYTKEDSYIILGSQNGLAIKFHEKDIRPMGRAAAGVRGMSLSPKDAIVGMTVIGKTEEIDILSVAENGYGKRTKASEYRLQSRGGKGIINMKVSERNGPVVAIHAVNDSSDLMMITDTGQIIRTRMKEISTIGRNTQGIRLVRLKPTEKLMAVQPIVEKETDEK